MILRPYFFLVVLIIFGQTPVAVAAPYRPVSDAAVLERLPFKPNDPVGRAMSALRAELRRNPNNMEAAVRLAQRYYDLVGEEGDPRYLGYAQAALAPWWDLALPPVEVQVMRANLLQFRHDFKDALADLSRVIERVPQHPQARAVRATIHIVQGRYAQARTDCSALRGNADTLISVGCVAMVDGLTGKAAEAYTRLHAALDSAPEAPPEEKLWALQRLAEMSQRLGRASVAEGHFKQAIALGIPNTFLYAAYADFLLDQGRASEVVALLNNSTRSDVLLLRLVFAEAALNLPIAKEHESILAARYAAAQLRGDTVHQQEEARFALHRQQDPQKALKLAQENWTVQLEPRDARIFLEAAIAAKNPQAAQAVLQWMAESHIEDIALAKLAQQLRGSAR